MAEIRTPSPDAVQRIQKAVRMVEKMPHDLTGQRRHAQPGQQGFWARITHGQSLTVNQAGAFGHSWEQIVPTPRGRFTRDPDGPTGEENAHNLQPVTAPPGTIVFLSFVGFAEDDAGDEQPQYVFSWGQERESRGVPNFA